MPTYTTPRGKSYTLYKDMLRQPHLLIAGATGSGKSVVINGMIYTALYRFPGDTPDGAQFILIDPKRVELYRYHKLPHTIRYASEPAEMIDALRLAMEITESRYKSMRRKEQLKYPGGDVFVIIDEMADLITTQGRTVVPLLQRLAQIGRAARVHLIGATQRPTNDVIGNKITVNLDARVGLRTRNKQDSRNIIGRAGLETLPRYGQGVYLTPEGETLYNIPMIDDAEIQRLIDHWTAQKTWWGRIKARMERSKRK